MVCQPGLIWRAVVNGFRNEREGSHWRVWLVTVLLLLMLALAFSVTIPAMAQDAAAPSQELYGQKIAMCRLTGRYGPALVSSAAGLLPLPPSYARPVGGGTLGGQSAMDGQTRLASLTGAVDQDILLRHASLAAENGI
jgi:hypothetical protein